MSEIIYGVHQHPQKLNDCLEIVTKLTVHFHTSCLEEGLCNSILIVRSYDPHCVKGPYSAFKNCKALNKTVVKAQENKVTRCLLRCVFAARDEPYVPMSSSRSVKNAPIFQNALGDNYSNTKEMLGMT